MSYFTSIACKTPILRSVESLLGEIIDPPPAVVALIFDIRKFALVGDKKTVARLKRRLAAVTVSGIFEGGHEIAHLKELNGLMQADFDHVENLTQFRQDLRSDPHVLVEFLSPSGSGSKAILQYTGNHEATFIALIDYFKEHYNVSLDTSCRDVSRLMFLSHDPDAYYNSRAIPFSGPDQKIEKPKAAPPTPRQAGIVTGVSADVEKIIDQLRQHHIDITGSYRDWLKLGFAIASEFGDSGRGYFHEISQYSPSYDQQDCDRQYAACCKGNGVGKASIRTLFGYAKDYGIDIKPVYAQPAINAPQEVKKAIPVATEPVVEQPVEPDDTQEMLLRPIQDSVAETDHFNKHGFFIRNSAYWVIERGKGKAYEIEVSNFVMEILFHFDDDTKNTRRLIKLQRNTGEIYIVEIQDNEATLERYEVILKSKKCTFYGNAYTLKRVFKFGMDNELSAKALVMLGYSPENDIYALSDAIIDNGKVMKVNEVGIVKSKENTFYLPAWSSYNRGNAAYVNERQFRYIEGTMTFNDWATNIYHAYDLNGAIGLCYVIQCLFRDIIFSQINFFPFLFLFGPAGVGKTTFIDILLRLLGDKDPGVSVKGSTIKAIARAASQRRNALLYLKEYDNSISTELENAFKNFYDGQGYSTAQTSNDNRTQTWLVHSGIIFDGNALPTKSNPFFDRNIVLTFDHNNFTKVSTEAYNTLKCAFDEGFGQVLVEILSHRDYFKGRIKKAFAFVYNQLKGYEAEFEGEIIPAGDLLVNGVNVSKMPDRTLNHIAFILSNIVCLKGRLTFPFTYEDICRKVISDAIEKNDMMSEINDISLFWDSLSYTIKVDPLKVVINRQYMKEDIEGLIYIRMNDLYPVYVDYCRKTNLVHADRQTLTKLLTSESYTPFLPGNQHGRGKSLTKHGFGSCYRFRFENPKNGEKGILIGGKEVML